MSVTTWPWHIRSSTLVILIACVVVTFVLTVWIIRAGDTDMRVIANTVNLLGAALTFAGLLYAYVRSDLKLRAWWQRAWARITGRPLPGAHGWANATFEVETSATGWLGYQFSDAKDRTEQLLQFVNALSARIGAAEGRIGDVGRALERARTEAREGDRQTRAEAEAALRQFAADLKQSQVLDLRWAIAGVFFSMFGAVLSFYA